MCRSVVRLSSILVLAAFLTGCAAYGVSPVTGIWFTDVKGPASATSNSGYSKVGMAYCTSILGLVATGDASIKAAMANGGITKIHHVDYETKSYFGIYAKFTVIVYGE